MHICNIYSYNACRGKPKIICTKNNTVRVLDPDDPDSACCRVGGSRGVAARARVAACMVAVLGAASWMTVQAREVAAAQGEEEKRVAAAG